MGGSGDAAKKTAEQKAMERRQRMQLDEETAASERRLKAVAQRNVGKQSLLGEPIEQAEAPEGPTITEGYMKSGGQVVKKPKRRGGLFGRILGATLGASAVGQGVKAGSLIGKGAEKAVKKATK
jgi:hypothetical protein